MVGKLTPVYIPMPAGLLGWDGTDFYALKVDTTGRLRVRGEDQLISYKDQVVTQSYGVPSGANGYRESAIVPASAVWVVTHIASQDDTTATTTHRYFVRHGGADYGLYTNSAALGIGGTSSLATRLYLVAGDTIKVFFTGALAGDMCGVWVYGHSMTKEL
jgi:hypothetical protein